MQLSGASRKLWRQRLSCRAVLGHQTLNPQPWSHLLSIPLRVRPASPVAVPAALEGCEVWVSFDVFVATSHTSPPQFRASNCKYRNGNLGQPTARHAFEQAAPGVQDHANQ